MAKIAARIRPKKPAEKAIESQMKSKYCFSGFQSHI